MGDKQLVPWPPDPNLFALSHSPQSADEAIDGALGVQGHNVPDVKKAGHLIHGFGPPGLEAARSPRSVLPGSVHRTKACWAKWGAAPPRSPATQTIGTAGVGWQPPESEEAPRDPGPGEEVPASLRARSPPARPGPRVPAAWKEQEVWGRHTHANPAWEAGRPHPAPPPPPLPRAPAPGARPLYTARVHACTPKSAQRATGRPPGL